MQKRPTAVVVIYSASILHIVEAFILAGASRAALLGDQDDDLLVIPVDELRAIVESHL